MEGDKEQATYKGKIIRYVLDYSVWHWKLEGSKITSTDYQEKNCLYLAEISFTCYGESKVLADVQEFRSSI